MSIRIPNLTEKQLKKMLKPDMSEKTLQKIRGQHSDMTQKKPLPTPEERITTLEKQMDEMKQLVAYIKSQSEEAYAKAFNLEHRVNTVLGENTDGND